MQRAYLFALSDGGYIDGRRGGNATRRLNHCCAPNCHAQEYRRPDGRLEIRIETFWRWRPMKSSSSTTPW
ncbi:MAG: SET domain-containing protein [Alphaproteobacteria bacterium]|nr:MAG: SET domain-containing protein [Alphaproteobacteria bacterium]